MALRGEGGKMRLRKLKGAIDTNHAAVKFFKYDVWLRKIYVVGLGFFVLVYIEKLVESAQVVKGDLMQGLVTAAI